jgi:O-antigen/teichoic acid export membrane protein
MNPSNRIALNTAATYTRSIIAAGLALFSSRWVLAALGQTDYGLFSVVGSIIIFITFLNTTMAVSVARHYAFSIGKGDSTEVGRWFNAALSIHLSLAAVLILIGWPVGECVIAYVLTIPVDRISACLWIFRISLVSAFVSMISVPFIAMFTAKQRIADLAIWNIFYSLMAFFLAWFLTCAHGDRLMFYAVGMVGILVFVQFAQVFLAKAIFHECRINYRQLFDKRMCKDIVSFAGWSMIGSSGLILRNQGSAILLNLRFGPNVNAAYGIANQVSAQTDQLAAAMIGAFSPEIITSEGHGNRARMLSLAQRANKFGAILVLLFAIPLIAEMDYVLKVWLIQPPLYSGMFCQLILTSFIIGRLSAGDQYAVHATGKIATYEIIAGTCLVLTLPLAWIFLKLGAPPTGVGAAFIATALAFTTGRAFLTSRVFGAPVRQWVVSVVVPCGIVCFVALLAALLPRLLFPESLMRLICVIPMSITASLLTAWFLAFDKREREFFGQSLQRILIKIIGVWNRS